MSLLKYIHYLQVVFQDHLNASLYSNNFYKRRGINYSVITNDITKFIKDNTYIEISIENGFATSDTSSSMEIGEWETGEF